MNKAIFLDRDGTLIKEKHYLCDPDQVELEDGAIESLQQFQKHGFKLIIITNQSGIGRGYFKVPQFLAVQRRLADILEQQHITLSDFYYCPDYPKAKIHRFRRQSPNRKPGPGMILKAIKDHQLKVKDCYLIGDKTCDTDAATAANITSILVQTGHNQNNTQSSPKTNFIASNLKEACHWILNRSTPP